MFCLACRWITRSVVVGGYGGDPFGAVLAGDAGDEGGFLCHGVRVLRTAVWGAPMKRPRCSTAIAATISLANRL